MKVLPEGPHYFPKDQITDQPERFLVAELIREQVLLAPSRRCPTRPLFWSSVRRGREADQHRSHHLLRARRAKGNPDRQAGETLKKIGTAARLQIERLLNTKVFLELFVKVRPGWRESRQFVEETNWRRQLEQMSSAGHDDVAEDDSDT